MRGTIVTGLLLGIGLAGFADEALVHQILQWHTFLWGTTPSLRLLSDGLFHVVTTLLLVVAAFRLWLDPAGRASGARRIVGGAALIGAGGFNLYDGIVQHALFHFHLVNEYVCAQPQANNSLANCPRDVPYELVWDALAAALIVAGVLTLKNKPGDVTAVEQAR